MAPARLSGAARALLGALLLAGAARALQPVGDAAGDEAPALEKEEWPRRKARRSAGQLIGTDDSLHGFGQGSETDDDLDLHDGLPPDAGCYMRMPSGCPKQPMRTHAWRRDKMATERGLDEEGCHQRKEVWERYCGSEDAEMLYVSGLASSGPVSALQVDASALQVSVNWWPWGKKHESTKHEVTNDEEVQAVPLGEVVISHAGWDDLEDEYLYASQDDDSEGVVMLHTWVNGPNVERRSILEDPQARWNISKFGGKYAITHAGSKDEYLFATQSDDSRGGHYVHTGLLQEADQARWNIAKVGGNFVITHAGSFKDEYLCATQQGSLGWRFVHALVNTTADDPQALWTITPVAKKKARSADARQTLPDVLVGYPSQPGCYMRMPSGCPKRPMKTHMWRHDAWAEEHQLDRAGCEERKRVWDRYCDADDARVFFVPMPPKQ